VFRLFGAHPRGERILAVLRQPAEDSFDPFRRLSLGVDNFGEPAPPLAVEIDGGECEFGIGHVRSQGSVEPSILMKEIR